MGSHLQNFCLKLWFPMALIAAVFITLFFVNLTSMQGKIWVLVIAIIFLFIVPVTCSIICHKAKAD